MSINDKRIETYNNLTQLNAPFKLQNTFNQPPSLNNNTTINNNNKAAETSHQLRQQ